MDEKKVREAIEAFQGQVDWLKRIDDKECEESRRCCIEYFETAIEALEKQLPKKPKQADEQRIRYCTTHVCPGCGKEFTGMVSEYCYHCGQRIEHDD